MAGLFSTERPCKILHIGSSFLVWNADDAIQLRNERIIGALIGTVPKMPLQNDQLTMPLKLMREQVQLLKSRGIAQIVRFKPDQVLPRLDDLRKAYEHWIQSEIERQSVETHKKTIQARMAYSRQIAEGRKTKRHQAITDDDNGASAAKQPRMLYDIGSSATVTSEELADVEMEIQETPLKMLQETDLQREIFPESPWSKKDEQFELEIGNFDPQNDLEKMRDAVFKDLWEKGYFLTGGVKFGGDFLAYPGDPLQYHASHIVVCLPENCYSSIDISAWCRLGTQVKKIVLLCTWDKSGPLKISYQALQWKRNENH